mmetsp:Transcript_47638/g.51484  ORF Transcript_47638/g.51484 Transcript_47638/m.51484 type:complete len:317 (+) Transcript_47638:536-1486(+)
MPSATNPSSSQQEQQQQHHDLSLLSPTTPSPTAAATASSLSLLTILIKDIVANAILGRGYISDKTIKRFLQALGEQRVTKLYKLDQQFCRKHGSKLEDSNTFQNHDSNTSSSSTIKTNKTHLLCCPECYAEEQHLKRCNGCKKFHSHFFFGTKTNNHTPTTITTIVITEGNNNGSSNTNTNTDGPGLWFQQCDKMAFCNACLSNDVDGCGANCNDDDDTSNTTATTTNYCKRRNKFGTGRVTCHNCCCPNVFTSTMYGEFVCNDCGEQHIDYNSGDNTVEVCDECEKATCLDPNCYVCANFKSINISCVFFGQRFV